LSAKHKLNAGYFQGAFFIAGLIGLLTDSATVFLMTFTIMLLASLHAGEIRR
jgi:hypothetical protein